MKNFILALLTQLATISELLYIRVWNNQLDWGDVGKLEAHQHPAAFIEFVSTKVMQLGGGTQLFDPLIFKIHILHWQMDAGDGTFEQNLDVYDLKDKVYLAIQKFQPNTAAVPVGACIRTAEYQDYRHHGVYHYVQEYKTTLVDNSRNEPLNGGSWPPGNPGDPTSPAQIEIDVTVEGGIDPSAPHVFIETPTP